MNFSTDKLLQALKSRIDDLVRKMMLRDATAMQISKLLLMSVS